MITLRSYRPSDAPALLALFKETIRRVNRHDYSPEQIAAWASDDIDPIRWVERFEGRFAVVAEIDSAPVGFAELEANGHVDRVYVSAAHRGQGVGLRLMESVFNEARRIGLCRLYVEASITARPFFEARGFALLAEQTVVCRGIAMTNCRMERRMEA
jgi:putative acetyltransferase